MFDVGELLGARGCTKAKRVKGGGTLFAHVRKSEGTGLLRLKLKGVNLKSTEGMGLLRKSDPFFEISRKIDSAGGNTWDNVYRSDPIKNNLNPDWSDAIVELSILCGGDLSLPLQICIYDYESSGKHVLMGQFETSVDSLAATQGTDIQITRKGKPTGKIHIVKAEVAGAGSTEEISQQISKMSVASVSSSTSPSPPSFVDYISGGCEINVVVAIDFTGSNGDPRKEGTLHHMSSNSYNPYEKAITSILSVLSKYDSDKKYPVLGFGAKYDGVVRHCFQVGPNEEVTGVDGVLDAYNGVFRSGLVMSSPTVFVDVIQSAASRAMALQQEAHKSGRQSYTVLLIVTDGAVSDPQATAECLSSVSSAPLSVVIVGVGDADFSSMEFLDDFTKDGQRDIAQFVQFNKHSHSSVELSSVTLKEIPDQLVSYFQSKGIQPNKPVECDEAEIVIEPEEEEIDLSLDVNEEEIVVSGSYTPSDVWKK